MSQPNNVMQYAGLASQWMVTLSLSVWLGYKIDYHWLAWKLPVFTALFPILTLIFLLYKIIIEFNKHTGKK
jgi:hypothetical protein